MEADEELVEIQREFERIRASTGKPIFSAPLRARPKATNATGAKQSERMDALSQGIGNRRASVRRQFCPPANGITARRASLGNL
jgi:hypothetical protein